MKLRLGNYSKLILQVESSFRSEGIDNPSLSL
jgi:hypothetical protein